MLKFCALSSGSSGNAYYISAENAAILVDAGISCTKIKKSLEYIGESIESVSAVFVTHEHSDHISGLRTLLKKHDITLYVTGGTRGEIGFLDDTAVCREPVVFESGDAVRVGDLTVHSYRISHDARDPVCYKVESDSGEVAGIITDLGWADPSVVRAFYDCDLLLLESNHDVEVLKIGPYPAFLKARILSKQGHLSNDDAGIIARNILSAGRLRHLVLGHLSETNNHPDLAYATVESRIGEMGFVCGEDYELDVMRRGQIGRMYIIKKALVMLLFAVISFFGGLGLSDGVYAEPQDEELLLREQVLYDIPVLSVVVTREGRRELFFSRELDSGALRDYDAPFQAGSMARVTTSLALLNLLDKKNIDVDAHIAEYLPAELVAALREDVEGLRFSDIFLHTTGYTNGRYRTISKIPYNEDIAGRALEYLMRAEKKLLTGEYSIQANSDFAFMGLLVERLSGKSFASAMRDFFDSAGMLNSSVEIADGVNVTQRYLYNSGLMSVAPEYFAYLPAADDFVTTLEDIEKLCLFLTTGDFAGKHKVFSKVFTNINEKTARSMIFNYVELGSAQVFMLDAALPGAYGRLVFVPEKRLGFFVYYNVGRVEAREKLTNALIERYVHGESANGVSPSSDKGAAQDYKIYESAGRLAGYYSPVNISSKSIENAIGLTHQLRINRVADGLLIDDEYFRALSETLYYCEASGKYMLFELDERGGLRYMLLEGELYTRAFSSNVQLSLLGVLAICALVELVYVVARWNELLAGRVDDRPRVWLLFSGLIYLGCLALTFFALQETGYWSVAYGDGLAHQVLRYAGWTLPIAAALSAAVLIFTRDDYKWRGGVRLLIWLSLPLGGFLFFFALRYGFILI